jgi:hypothetical protein
MKRNPEANCGNCPYYYKPEDEKSGWCRHSAELATSEGQYEGRTNPNSWCGDHPDFFAAEKVLDIQPPDGV